jgi:hypothetical protein
MIILFTAFILDLHIVVDVMENVKKERRNLCFFFIFIYFVACSNDCSVEARLSDSFRIKKADFDAVIIVRKYITSFSLTFCLLF